MFCLVWTRKRKVLLRSAGLISSFQFPIAAHLWKVLTFSNVNSIPPTQVPGSTSNNENYKLFCWASGREKSFLESSWESIVHVDGNARKVRLDCICSQARPCVDGSPESGWNSCPGGSLVQLHKQTSCLEASDPNLARFRQFRDPGPGPLVSGLNPTCSISLK
jgi:hypothetical protein